MYNHTEEIHNLFGPRQIVEFLHNKIRPNSVVDVGCGIGTFLYCFKEKGVQNVIGIDGKWVNNELKRKYLKDSEFIEHNLDEKIELSSKFDLVLCLEVAEHLKEDSANILIETLINLGDIIIFSAAIPNQGGQNHINEQWPSYWIEKFNSYNFFALDCLRPAFAENNSIEWWYRQNIMLLVKESRIEDVLKIFPGIKINSFTPSVSKELFESKTDFINYLESSYYSLIFGKAPIREYIKIFFRKIKNVFYNNNMLL
jgi:SAM-dependent methyltransferase